MSEWQTFDSAPKDGNPFIAWDGDDGGGIYNGVVIARWVECEEDPDESEWEVMCPLAGDCLHGCNLTHWQPFPSAPALS